MFKGDYEQLFITFIKVFAILFCLLIVLPLFLDHLAHHFNKEAAPDDSVNVFKGIGANNEIFTVILNSLRKIIGYM